MTNRKNLGAWRPKKNQSADDFADFLFDQVTASLQREAEVGAKNNNDRPPPKANPKRAE